MTLAPSSNLDTASPAPGSTFSATADQADTCLHCGQGLRSALLRTRPKDPERFCCSGCEFVYALLHDRGLDRFYALREGPPLEPVTADPQQSSLDYFASPDYLARHVTPISDTTSSCSLGVTGLHCAACAWLLERLPRIAPGVVESRVNFITGAAEIFFDTARTSPEAIARSIAGLGYRPVPPSGEGADEERRRERRMDLLRLGVAAVCTGNIMTLTISLYEGFFTGIEESYAHYFRVVSLLLTIPVVTFSAMPFYRGALSALRTATLHLDLPIAIGIIAGFGGSLWSTYLRSPHVYFDSLTMLVFLLLGARMIQDQMLDRARRLTAGLPSLFPPTARIAIDSGESTARVDTIEPGTTLLVGPGEVLTADGTVTEGEALYDAAVLTGEPLPRKAAVGDRLFAGIRVTEGSLRVEAAATAAESRMVRVLEESTRLSRAKSPLMASTIRLSRLFIALVLVSSVLLVASLVILGYPAHDVFSRTLAFLVVACPCALGIAAPLTLAKAASEALRHGICLSNPAALETITRARTLFFDKTGTLTEGLPTVVRAFAVADPLSDEAPALEPFESVPLEIREEISAAVRELEAKNLHPFRLAFEHFFETEGLTCQTFGLIATHAIAGRGIEGTDRQGRTWRIGSVPFVFGSFVLGVQSSPKEIAELRQQGITPVALSCNERLIALFGISDPLRPGAREAVEKLRSQGYSCIVLSGDDPEVVVRVAAEIGITRENALGGLSPEEKAAIVTAAKGKGDVIMCGDGVNDAPALSAASCGVALRGGALLVMSGSDVTLLTAAPHTLLTLVRGARGAVAIVRRNIAVSLVYNVGGMACAAVGVLGPLGAALLMPLSSLSVILSTLLATKFSEE